MNAAQIHLLIVEPNETASGSLTRVCQQLQYSVTSVQDVAQGFTIFSVQEKPSLHKSEIDLIVFGPEISEHDICLFLEKTHSFSEANDIPTLVTAYREDIEKIATCLEKGATDYMFTTCPSRLLQTRIEGCVEMKRLHAQAQAHVGLLQLERDMQIGRKIQTDFLPNVNKLPQPAGWDIVAKFHPARQVAGDFFDAFPVGRDKVGLVIADVCDKGVGPAIFMSLSRSLLRAFAEQHRPLNWLDSLSGELPPEEVQKRMKRQRMLLSGGTSALLAAELTNTYICENHGDMNMFATLFFGVLDPATGTLTYVNGGHDSPIIIDSTGHIKTRLHPTGPAIGVIPNADFDIEQTILNPGDLVMMFTDGVTDALNPQGEQFGEKQLFSLLQQPIVSVKDLLDQVVEHLQTHIAEADQFDDITMLAARRNPIPD